MSNVYQKLNNARAEFHTRKLKKSGHNKFAGYSYFELGDFLIPALEIFQKHNLCGVVSFGTQSATLTVVDMDKPEDKIEFYSPMSSAALKGCHEVQNLGAVQTYLRRYLWVTCLEIVEHDALDSSKPLDKKAVELVESRKSIAQDHFDKMDEDEQKFLREQAVEISAAENLLDAYESVTATLDNEEKIALWSLLPSPIRTRIKKEGEQKRAA